MAANAGAVTARNKYQSTARRSGDIMNYISAAMVGRALCVSRRDSHAPFFGCHQKRFAFPNLMTVIVKSKFSLTVPTEVQRQARRRNDRPHEGAAQKRSKAKKSQTLSMKVDYLPRALKVLEDASAQVAKAFFKHIS